MEHELKIEIPYYDRVLEGSKRFEIRNNDRSYQKGDKIVLKAWWPAGEGNCYCSERKTLRGTITYVTDYNQREGWVVFGFKLDDEIAYSFNIRPPASLIKPDIFRKHAPIFKEI